MGEVLEYTPRGLGGACGSEYRFRSDDRNRFLTRNSPQITREERIPRDNNPRQNDIQRTHGKPVQVF